LLPTTPKADRLSVLASRHPKADLITVLASRYPKASDLDLTSQPQTGLQPLGYALLESPKMRMKILTYAILLAFTPSLLPAQTAKLSAQVPFVGCKADGQVGPQKAPKGSSKTVAISPETASHLAYYAAK
jgi:hypothetical protein